MATIEDIVRAFPSGMKLPDEIRTLHEEYEWRNENGPIIARCVFAAPHNDRDIVFHSGGKRMLGALGTLFTGDCAVYCIWQANDNDQPVVCLADGQVPWVVAVNTMEFLRFLAIGYVSVCGDGNLDKPPRFDEGDCCELSPNFPIWLEKTFGVSIPEVGLPIYEEAQARFADDFAKWWEANNDL